MTEAARHRLVVALWMLAGTAACAAMVPLEPNLLEEGIVLHLAQRMATGEHLFRDLASFTGPLPFELLALLFRVFGDELWVARGSVAVMHGVACGALYALGRLSRAGPMAHLFAASSAVAPVLLFPLFSLFFYAVTLFHIAAVAAWATARGTNSARHAAAAGALVACAALCKQNVGAALALSFAVALVASPGREDRLRRMLGYVAGGAAVTLATLLLYLVRGDLGVMFNSLVWLPLSFRDTFDAPYPNMWPLGTLREDVFLDRARYLPSLYGYKFGVFGKPGSLAVLTTQLLYALPFLAIAATALAALRGHKLAAGTWVSLALLVAFVTNLFPRTDWGHLVYVLPLAVAQLALLCRPRRHTGAIAAACVVALAVSTLSAGAWLHSRSGGLEYGEQLPLRGVSNMLKGQPLPRLIEILRAHTTPGEPIFVARSEPLIYYATGTSNPTPYSGVIPGIRDEQEERILQSLGHLRFAVMSDIDQPAYLYYSDELPCVQARLERRFQVVGQMPPGWLTLLERRGDRGATAIDFFDRRVEGRYFERRRDGSLHRWPPDQGLPRLAARQNRRLLPLWLGDGGGAVEFDVQVPEAAQLQVDAGLWQAMGLRRAWDHPRDMQAVLSISRNGRDFQRLTKQALLYGRDAGHRWKRLGASLADYAGEHVTLRFELRALSEIESDRLAWLGSPRIALRPGSAGALAEERKALSERSCRAAIAREPEPEANFNSSS